MISAWWLLLVVPATYGGFVFSNWLWTKNGYRVKPERINPYRTKENDQ